MEMNYKQRHEMREAIKKMASDKNKNDEYADKVIEMIIQKGKESGIYLGRHALFLPDMYLLDKENGKEVAVLKA